MSSTLLDGLIGCLSNDPDLSLNGGGVVNVCLLASLFESWSFLLLFSSVDNIVYSILL